MPCACLSRQKKKSSRAVLPLQTNLPPPHETQVNPSLGATLEPHSPFLKLGRLTLLARIERAFNHSLAEEKIEFPLPLQPESIVGRLMDSLSTDGIDSPAEIKGNQLPKHPNSAGLIRQSSGPRPKKLLLDMLPDSRSHSLIITPSNTRKSQYAVVLDKSQPMVQPPISPEPTPTFEPSNSPFHQGFQSSKHSPSSTDPTGSSAANSSIPQDARVLRPCLGELLTPPLTPPPTIPLPPIPTASPCSPWPITRHSVSVISRSRSANECVRDFPHPQDLHPDALEALPPINRPRSKSSPLRSEVKRAPSQTSPLPIARQLRFLSPPQSFISDSELTDDTNPTSEEGEPNSIPIALFESTYSPPIPPPVIQKFFHQQYRSFTGSSPPNLPLQENFKPPS